MFFLLGMWGGSGISALKLQQCPKAMIYQIETEKAFIRYIYGKNFRFRQLHFSAPTQRAIQTVLSYDADSVASQSDCVVI